MSTTDQDANQSAELKALIAAHTEVFEKFEELIRNPEPLHPDLALYMDETAWFGGTKT